MKYIIFILTIFSFVSCKAQTVYNIDEVNETLVQAPYYIKDIDNHHDAIVGVWRWEEGDDYFEITLQEFEMYSYPNGSTMFRDKIFGKYKYVVDGEVISEVSTIEPLPNFNLSLYFETSSRYNLVITDIISEKTKKGKFTLTSNTTAEIEFFDIKGIIVGGNGNGQEWSLPTSVTLTKIN